MLTEIANGLLWINLTWYIVLALAFGFAGIYPKSIYFAGAAILTIGIIVM